jgi:hypothetical protein
MAIAMQIRLVVWMIEDPPQCNCVFWGRKLGVMEKQEIGHCLEINC